MAIDRRAILAAIAAETADRSGPMPAWLVPVAVNAKDKAASNAVDAELVALRAEALIDYQCDARTLALTDAGRRALRDLNQGKPAKAATKPKAVDQSPATPPAPPPAPSAPPVDPERVDPERQPELAALLCELAGEIAGHLHDARTVGDVETLQRYRALGQRLQRHIQLGGGA